MSTLLNAFHKLMPLGGWSYSKETGLVIHEDGKEHGYKKPTQKQIDQAIEELEAEAYKDKRAEAYPAIGEQLDAIWKELNPTSESAVEMKALIEKVKADFPKGK